MYSNYYQALVLLALFVFVPNSIGPVQCEEGFHTTDAYEDDVDDRKKMN